MHIFIHDLKSLFESRVEPSGPGRRPDRPDYPDVPPERAKIDPSRLDSRSDGPFRPTKSTQDRCKTPPRRSRGSPRAPWSAHEPSKTSQEP